MLHVTTRLTTPLLLSLTLAAGTARAEVCDYRPSRLLGEAVGEAAGAVSKLGGNAIAGDGGFYTLLNATSGLTLLGTKLAASGTAAGIGSSGSGAGVASVVANPGVWIPALVIGAGGVGYEATCALFVDERITDYDAVLKVMRDFQDHSDPRAFRLVEDNLNPFIELHDADGTRSTYEVADLYIVDGMLRHRAWGPNRTIGRVVFVPTEISPNSLY